MDSELAHLFYISSTSTITKGEISQSMPKKRAGSTKYDKGKNANEIKAAREEIPSQMKDAFDLPFARNTIEMTLKIITRKRFVANSNANAAAGTVADYMLKIELLGRLLFNLNG